MPRDSREPIVRIDYDENYAEVWTERTGLIQRLQRLGWDLTDRQGRGVWLRGSMSGIKFKSVAKLAEKSPRKGNLEALAKARAAKAERQKKPA